MKKTILAKNIRKLRLFKNLNQAEFAALFDLKRPSVGAYEEGRAEPKFDTLIKISNHFGITIDEIVKGELTVNQIAKFEHPTVNSTDLLVLNEKLDALFLRIDLMDKKLNKTFPDKP